MLTPRDLLILGFVSRRPTYGHEIKQRIATTYAERWVRISQPHIYYVLEKLKKAKYLTSREEKVGNTPPRTVYTITEQGRRALETMLRSDKFLQEDYSLDFYVVLAMLGYTRSLSHQESIAIIEKRKKVVDGLVTAIPDLSGDSSVWNRFGPIGQAIFEHHLKALKTELRWLEKMLSRIRDEGWEVFAGTMAVEKRPYSRKKVKEAVSV